MLTYQLAVSKRLCSIRGTSSNQNPFLEMNTGDHFAYVATSCTSQFLQGDHHLAKAKLRIVASVSDVILVNPSLISRN